MRRFSCILTYLNRKQQNFRVAETRPTNSELLIMYLAYVGL
jgi:hypothetical protein